MHPFLMLILAIVTPFLMLATLLIPPYLGMYGACYIVYAHGLGNSPLAGKYLDVFYIIDVYSKLLQYWMAHMRTLSFVYYTLPVVALPLATVSAAIYLTLRVARKLKDIFHIGVSH